jgi:hypothetical protein
VEGLLALFALVKLNSSVQVLIRGHGFCGVNAFLHMRLAQLGIFVHHNTLQFKNFLPFLRSVVDSLLRFGAVDLNLFHAILIRTFQGSESDSAQPIELLISVLFNTLMTNHFIAANKPHNPFFC